MGRLDNLAEGLAALNEKQTKELGEAIGIFGAVVGTRWYMRRRLGATKVQAYVASSALTSLTLIALRIKQLTEAVEKQESKVVNVSQSFPTAPERVSAPMTAADLKIRGL